MLEVGSEGHLFLFLLFAMRSSDLCRKGFQGLSADSRPGTLPKSSLGRRRGEDDDRVLSVRKVRVGEEFGGRVTLPTETSP